MPKTTLGENEASQLDKLTKFTLDGELPSDPNFIEGIRRATKRDLELSKNDIMLAVRNALRYVPTQHHEALAPEFLQGLLTRGRIYAYRYRPRERIKAKPIQEYKGRCTAGK